MSISSPCGCSFFNFSALSSSSSVFFLCGEQCCKYVSWLNRMLFSWPWTTHAHLTLSLFLSHYFSLTYKHTYAYIQWRAMGPLLHNREDSWRGLLSQFRCNTKQIMYITFSVCLHRHSLGVLGGKKHDNTTLTSHLQVICSRFVWASGSVKFLFISFFLFLFFASHRGSLCYLSLCKKSCNRKYFGPQLNRYSWTKGSASVLHFIPAVSGCLYCSFGCVFGFICQDLLSWNVGQCVFVCCACCRAEARLRILFTPVCTDDVHADDDAVVVTGTQLKIGSVILSY